MLVLASCPCDQAPQSECLSLSLLRSLSLSLSLSLSIYIYMDIPLQCASALDPSVMLKQVESVNPWTFELRTTWQCFAFLFTY